MIFSDSDTARFWRYVDKSSDCWNWVGGIHKGGYGTFWLLGRARPAHRVAWVLHNGPIPAHDSYHGNCVCHRCDNPRCVNPDHLFLGTNADNMADRNAKGRTRRGPNKKNQGQSNGFAKLTEADVAFIRNHPGTLRQLGEMFGVSHSRIGAIKLGQAWTHLPNKETTE